MKKDRLFPGGPRHFPNDGRGWKDAESLVLLLGYRNIFTRCTIAISQNYIYFQKQVQFETILENGI